VSHVADSLGRGQVAQTATIEVNQLLAMPVVSSSTMVVAAVRAAFG
jgi:hypothetical protein